MNLIAVKIAELISFFQLKESPRIWGISLNSYLLALVLLNLPAPDDSQLFNPNSMNFV